MSAEIVATFEPNSDHFQCLDKQTTLQIYVIQGETCFIPNFSGLFVGILELKKTNSFNKIKSKLCLGQKFLIASKNYSSEHNRPPPTTL